MRKVNSNKIVLSAEQIRFAKLNHKKMTTAELAQALGLKKTVCRMRLYELGLYHLELEYWTKEQVNFLEKNYQKMGDTEIAEIFSKRWPKKKRWTGKHICKKRGYLKLKRSLKQLEEIKKRNIANGRYSVNHWKRWINLQAKVGTIRTWENITVIKTPSGWVHYAPFLWKEKYGRIPKGAIVTRKNLSQPISINNLELIDRKELARRNSIMRYPKELRTTIHALSRLNRKIKKYEEQD